MRNPLQFEPRLIPDEQASISAALIELVDAGYALRFLDCVRFSLSLCPKQAKGVTGVQGTVKAEPRQLINSKEELTLRFDCKACEMHVVGRMKTSVANQSRQQLATVQSGLPITFHKTRPRQEFGH